MLKRLRLKFVVINMTIVTVMLLVILWLIVTFTSANLETQSIRMMQGVAITALRPGEPPPEELPEGSADIRLPFFGVALGPGGQVLNTVGNHDDLLESAALEALTEEALASPKHFGVMEDQALRYYRVETPSRQYVVFADITSELDTLRSLRTTCLIIGSASFLAFLWISILLSKWAVRPVEDAFTRQRQFIAAASHELKTPLTVIMTNAQLLSSPMGDEKKKAGFVGNILTMSSEMRRLIDEMLHLARLDSPETKPELRPVSLSKVIADALLPFEPIFFEQNLTLTSDIQEDITVSGDAAQLRQVVEILLDNAQKYAAPGGSALVTLKRCRRNTCLLTVSNDGDPIPEEALPELFKRFYRADPARSRSGSFGLGLSIAETIVEHHRGKIWAESREGRNSFFVELPCLS